MGVFSFFANWRVIAVLAVAAFASYLIYSYRSDLRQAVYNEFYAEQVNQELRGLNDEIARLTDDNKKKEEVISKLIDKNEEIIKKFNELNELLDGEQDRPASDLMVKGVRKIEEIYK